MAPMRRRTLTTTAMMDDDPPAERATQGHPHGSRPGLTPSPSLESLASAQTRASYSHDYASDDYDSDDAHDYGHEAIEHGGRHHDKGAVDAPSTAGSSHSSATASSAESSSPVGELQQRRSANNNNNNHNNSNRNSNSNSNSSNSNYHYYLANARLPTSSNSSVQNFFGPPFYGRPPTPLPPSPSLTSLFRPSRPTTPDVSDDEAGGHAGQEHRAGRGGGGGGRDSSRHSHHTTTTTNNNNNNNTTNTEDEGPVRRASPRVPTYEYYGFVLYLFSSLCFGAYLLWAYLPSPFLHALGIYYYPNRWWALAIPAFLVAFVVYIFVALAAYNTEILTVKMAAVEAVVDGAANIAVIDSRGRIRGMDKKGRRQGGASRAEAKGGGASRSTVVLEWKKIWNEGTDAVMDVPLAGVCEVLYGGSGGGGGGGDDDAAVDS